MIAQAKPFSTPPKARQADEITAAALLGLLSEHARKALIFHYEGRDVLPGYHVTEVKTGSFEALDCGANFESWHETFIQLWDIPGESGDNFMPVAKFLAIIRKVSDRVPFDPDAKLTFEVSDGKSAMQLYRASSFAAEGNIVRVTLTRRPASCKPRDRWLEQQSVPHAAGSGDQKAACCT